MTKTVSMRNPPTTTELMAMFARVAALEGVVTAALLAGAVRVEFPTRSLFAVPPDSAPIELIMALDALGYVPLGGAPRERAFRSFGVSTTSTWDIWAFPS